MTQKTNLVYEAKLNQFIGQILGDLGGASSNAMVRIGDALGLNKTLHATSPMTCAELAAAVNVNERYLQEWLSHQAASNYLSYEPGLGRFALHRTGHGVRHRSEPRIPEGRIRPNGGNARQPAESAIRLQVRSWRGMEGTGRLHVLCRCPLLSARLSQPPRRELAPGSRRRAWEAGARRQGGRCGLWPWLVDRADGQVIPQLPVHRSRLSSQFDRGGAGARLSTWRFGKQPLRGGLWPKTIAPTSIWSPASIACMTWATQLVRRPTSKNP
jgi:hypothetical protein